MNKNAKNIHKSIKNTTKHIKSQTLGYWQKIYNDIVAHKRIKVENILAQIKNFRILSHRCRNKCRAYNLKFNIVAGIVNLKNAFAGRHLVPQLSTA